MNFDFLPEKTRPFGDQAPLLTAKRHDEASVFLAENMIREARRQKNLPAAPVPAVCVLDPDGDLLRALQNSGSTVPCDVWACYHTSMVQFAHEGETIGIIGNAVGAAFAVLLAEQLFASGCEILFSLSSAGQIFAAGPAPYFILIERALRDEGTSYHYLPPSRYAEAPPALLEYVRAGLLRAGLTVHAGASWTTDAPFRETPSAIAAAHAEGILAVEMEAAALYAFAAARRKNVICLAQVTNQMGQVTGDFEKGQANGADDALAVLVAAIRAARQGVA